MDYSAENVAHDFLELASEQRLGIILRLLKKKSNVSAIAKELGATVAEVYRNFERLVKAELIMKDTDGKYHLTTYGKTVCAQIPSLVFVAENRKYFKDHDFGDVPTKFIKRIGELRLGQYVDGFIRVQEKWKEIYKNADEYIFNILSEVSYTADIIEPLVAKIKNGVKVKSIFSESVIIPNERRKVLEKFDFDKFIEKGLVERRMRKDVSVVVVLTDKEACVMFPTSNGKADISGMFYSIDSSFRDWCLDYFRHCWQDSVTFREAKLKEQ